MPVGPDTNASLADLRFARKSKIKQVLFSIRLKPEQSPGVDSSASRIEGVQVEVLQRSIIAFFDIGQTRFEQIQYAQGEHRRAEAGIVPVVGVGILDIHGLIRIHCAAGEGPDQVIAVRHDGGVAEVVVAADMAIDRGEVVVAPGPVEGDVTTIVGQ